LSRDHHVLWRVARGDMRTACLMVTCCAGAELQVLRSAGTGEEEIVLRELYPDRDALYARARELHVELDGPKRP
jgi:hypothetical protein